MSAKFFLGLAFFLLAISMVLGCEDKASATRIDCVNVNKITDPQRKAELLKRCPRMGPEFKPSPKVYW